MSRQAPVPEIAERMPWPGQSTPSSHRNLVSLQAGTVEPLAPSSALGTAPTEGLGTNEMTPQPGLCRDTALSRAGTIQ